MVCRKNLTSFKYFPIINLTPKNMKKTTAARPNKRVTKGSPFSPLARQLGMFALLMAVVGSGLSYSAKAKGDVLGTNRYALVQSDPYTTRTTTPKPTTRITASPTPYRSAVTPTKTSTGSSTSTPAPTARPTSYTQLAVPTSTPKPITPSPTTYACNSTNCPAPYVKCVNNVCVPAPTPSTTL